MKKALFLSVCLLVLAGSPAFAAGEREEPAAADVFPTGPIEIIIPGGAGGGVDVPVRAMAPFLEAELGVPIVPNNLAGATGAIAYTALARSRPDGYTIGYTTSPAFVTVYVQGALYAHPIEDFEHLAQVIFNAQAITVRADSPFQSFEELLAYAESNPESLSLTHTGAASVKALMGNLLADEGYDFRLVAMDGDAGTIVSLLGGHVDAGIIMAPLTVEYVESGDMRVLALSGHPREDLPGVPTFEQVGFSMPIGGTTHGFVAPKGVDPAILATLRQAIHNVIHNPEFQAEAQRLGLNLSYADHDSYREFLQSIYPVLRAQF